MKTECSCTKTCLLVLSPYFHDYVGVFNNKKMCGFGQIIQDPIKKNIGWAPAINTKYECDKYMSYVKILGE